MRAFIGLGGNLGEPATAFRAAVAELRAAPTGEEIDIGGSGVTASIEGGYPFPLANGWTLEPQAQLIWQRVSFDDAADAFSSIGFDAEHAVTARIGARLHGSYDTAIGVVRPYLKANLWHDVGSTDRVTLGDDVLASERKGTALELGGGVVSRVSEGVSVFAVGDVRSGSVKRVASAVGEGSIAVPYIHQVLAGT